ncbi:hypothetical protein PCURB6_02510 [Paenibacillus curdlanolyticus]|nr:hypothetical protein PCURB6_02510 [Paenibacillus curdlanolyticus]
MNIRLMLSTVFLFILLTGCTNPSIQDSNVTDSSLREIANASSESWSVDKLIRFKSIVYVGSDEKVAKSEIQEEMGRIEQSSDDDAAENKESFSNYYPAGTKLYKIKGRSPQEAIAVEVDKNTYVLATIKKD